jgi:hypothetical protein
MKKCNIVFVCLVMFSITNGQNLTFTDTGLKNYLVHGNCVDLDYDGWGDTIADVNLDGEIQFSEAQALAALSFVDLSQITDTIYSLQELNYFSNLKQLRVYGGSQLQLNEIAGWDLDSLEKLEIEGFALNYIDLSNVNNLEYLTITSVTGTNGQMSGLSFLDIRNGSCPQYFSLFYTEHIVQSCVDSCSIEYNEVLQHMLVPNLPEVNCLFVSNYEAVDKNLPIKLIPNPCEDFVQISNAGSNIISYQLFDVYGKSITSNRFTSGRVELEDVLPGVYYLELILSDNRKLIEKVIKN